ncbi:MAG: Flp pilus assembly complex ATPase component TadA [Planctomycetes bacterium]|nr:Flp pilus assembly complex ATPase component TadA [Planctomycetota bacterium]MBI3847957.1 Flp pilus assembly complex ATPase component TadA [Planctomycetota bacterium]
MPRTKTRIGELLLREGIVSPPQLELALDRQRKEGGPLGQKLVSMGAITKDRLAEALSEHFGVACVDLRSTRIEPGLRETIPYELAKRWRALPLFRTGDSLMVALADPDDVRAVDAIEAHVGSRIDVCFAHEDDLSAAIDRFYGAKEPLRHSIGTLSQEFAAVTTADFEKPAPSRGPVTAGDDRSAPTVRLVNLLLGEAVERGASDVHIEPQRDGVRIRFRVDGLLVDSPAPPKRMLPAVVSRIKVLSDLDISESRIPQDGRFAFRAGTHEVDIRTSVIPTIYGENVVLRIMDHENRHADLDRIGLSPHDKRRLEEMISYPHGMVLVTGPTGSGKTSTLYAALSRINSIDRNIVTIEDPVEYHIDLVRQIQVNAKAGLTFANGLRAILRHDPDVIMVGEIRDPETADIAVQSALTGHLVFSTLHTNDGIGALTRLVDLGVEPFLIASATVGVVAQRLVRVLCPECREPITLGPEAAAALDVTTPPPLGATVFRARGCLSCRESGYRGRVGIFETLRVTPRLRELFLAKASPASLREEGERDGMRQLRDDGVEKALQGVTSLEEVLRVTQKKG